MQWQTQDQKKGKLKLHITAEKNWLRQSRKKAMTNRTKIINANSLHTVESLRRWASCCFSQPVSRMLATVLEWLTDFLTGAIMESRKAARSKAVASPPWCQHCNIIVGNSKWVKNHHFLLNYLTVLEYTTCTVVHICKKCWWLVVEISTTILATSTSVNNCYLLCSFNIRYKFQLNERMKGKC